MNMRALGIGSTAILAVGTALIAAASGAAPGNAARPLQPNLASACRADAVSTLARGLGTGVTVKQIPNGPRLEGGVKFYPAKGAVPAFCQVTGSYVTNPLTGKTSNFLATFPERWNGKFLQLGCSGGCGFLLMNDPNAPPIVITAQGYPGQLIEKGYATFGNDLGWTAPSPSAPLQWAVKADGAPDPEMVEDYLWRADSVLADTGKAFTRAFYSGLLNRPARIGRSYFSGCSQGGREALVAATRFPEKYDGIIAGSPAQDHPGIIFQGLGFGTRMQQGDMAKLTAGQVKLINDTINAQCDGLDGVTDGLIQNPAACNVHPSRIAPVCQPGQSGDSCLSQPQADAVSTWLSGLTDEAGNLLQPGYSISNNSYGGVGPLPTNAPIDAHVRMSIGKAFDGMALASHGAGRAGEIDAYRSVLNRKAWDAYLAFTRKGTIEPGDFSRLMRGRAKLLWYHNLSDEALTPYMSINRYKALAASQGGFARLQNRVRLFTLPGTGHCGMSGDGPGNFDAIGALEAWVERGKAPNALFARRPDPKSENMIMGTVNWSKSSPRTMPLCMFPQMASYKGSGDVNKAENWECRAGDTRMLTVGESGRQAGVMR